MRRDLTSSLSRLGFTPGNYRVLMLLPLVYVAWADGKMEDVEIERIDEVARQRFFFGARSLAMLDHWLSERPTQQYFREGLRDLFLLTQANGGDPLVATDELHELLAYSEAIARATANALDAPHSVTPEEQVALREIAAALHVDNGASWRELLDELEAYPVVMPHTQAPAPRRQL